MSLKDKIIKKGEKVFTKVVDKAIQKTPKEKQAAMLAKKLRGLIRFTGVAEMRRRVIVGIEEEFRNKLKDTPNLTVQDLIQEYLDEPEAMALFKDLDMGEDHLRAMAKNAIAHAVKGGKESEAT